MPICWRLLHPTIDSIDVPCIFIPTFKWKTPTIPSCPTLKRTNHYHPIIHCKNTKVLILFVNFSTQVSEPLQRMLPLCGFCTGAECRVVYHQARSYWHCVLVNNLMSGSGSKWKTIDTWIFEVNETSAFLIGFFLGWKRHTILHIWKILVWRCGLIFTYTAISKEANWRVQHNKQ